MLRLMKINTILLFKLIYVSVHRFSLYQNPFKMKNVACICTQTHTFFYVYVYIYVM